MGLAAFHIVHRTNSAPGWIWSTFEHIDNAPWIADFKVGTPDHTYSFFEPSTCPAKLGSPTCDYNLLPDHPWDPERTDLTPTQVIRIGAPGKFAIVANAKYREFLRQAYGNGGTVWENYFLVDVQFPTISLPDPKNVNIRVSNPAYPSGLPTPTFLANSLIETYIQGFTQGDITSNGNIIPPGDTMQNINGSPTKTNVDPWNLKAIYNQSGGAQRNSSSCVACHADAAMTTGTFSNYVFSLSRAESTSSSSTTTLRERIHGKVSTKH